MEKNGSQKEDVFILKRKVWEGGCPGAYPGRERAGWRVGYLFVCVVIVLILYFLLVLPGEGGYPIHSRH